MFDINRVKQSNIDGLMESIDKYHKKVENEIEFPYEFLDPISLSKIDEPRMIPDSGEEDIFMDKTVIEKWLLTEERNPFTRDKLTIEQLESYNSKPEVSCKLKDFKKRLKEWLKKKDSNK
jgi:hypothetical protein